MDDEQVFEGLWREHFDQVFRYLLRRSDADSAHDLTSETFAVAWRRLADVPDDALPWLLAVAQNKLAHHYRRRRRGRALIERLTRQPVTWSPPPGEGPRIDPILRAMAALAPGDREAIALSIWDGLDATQAGEVVGCSAATFSVRLHRARKRLLALLDETERSER